MHHINTELPFYTHLFLWLIGLGILGKLGFGPLIQFIAERIGQASGILLGFIYRQLRLTIKRQSTSR